MWDHLAWRAQSADSACMYIVDNEEFGGGSEMACLVCLEMHAGELHRQQFVEAGQVASFLGRVASEGGSLTGVALGSGLASLARGGSIMVSGAIAGVRASMFAPAAHPSLVAES